MTRPTHFDLASAEETIRADMRKVADEALRMASTDGRRRAISDRYQGYRRGECLMGVDQNTMAAFPLMPPSDEVGLPAQGYPYPENGLSKREYVATAMLAGLLAGRGGQQIGIEGVPGDVRLALDYADELLASVNEAIAPVTDQPVRHGAMEVDDDIPF